MPDSSGARVFDDLPEEVVLDQILVRLPPKDVLRCRAVRKSWRSGTSTDKFILDHHRRQPSLLIIHQMGTRRLAVLGGGGVSNDQVPVIQLPHRIMHHATCDGLLLMSREDEEDVSFSFYICNPTTRRCASLPHPPLRQGSSTVTVVGFYHTSGEHRVLWTVYSVPDFDDDDDDDVELPDYFVLRVGSDQPRLVQWPTVPDHGFPATRSSDCPPVHHRGSLHWPIGLNITVFDTVAETVRQMSRPAQLGNVDGNWLSLLDMGGALALCSITPPQCVTLDVWVLQDYDAETWGFQCRINLLAPQLDSRMEFVPMIAAINERELLIQKRENHVLHYDIDGAFLGNVGSEEHESCFIITPHRLQESMISLPLFEAQEEDAVNKEPPFVMVL